MKNITLKILTILIIIAICLISFIGIFVKEKNVWKNVLPEYKFAMDIAGARVVKYVVDDSTKQVVYDVEGKVIEDGLDEEGNLKEGYTSQDEPVNPIENLTQDNYNKSKEVIEKRLEAYGIDEYNLKLNEENGEIFLELYESSNTDAVIYNMELLGDFKITDSDTNEVLMDNSAVKSAVATYETTDYGTCVYLNIEFNKEGKKKIEEISNNYVMTIDEEGNSITKQIKISLEGEKLDEKYFTSPNKTGVLKITIGNLTTSSSTLNSYYSQAMVYATLINSGKMPIKYETSTNNNFSTGISQSNITVLAIFLGVIILIALIYLCIKHKTNGVLLSISYIGYIATLLIVLRYANVIISLNAIVGFVILAIINYMFTKYLLTKIEDEITKSEAIKKTYLRYISISFPILLISVVFTLISWIPIASIGMVLFWGIIIMFIYNYITINALVDNK